MFNPGKKLITKILLPFILIPGNSYLKAGIYKYASKITNHSSGYEYTVNMGQPKGTKPLTIQTKNDEGRTFIISTYSRDPDDFKKQVSYAAQLKPYGRVQINISTLADKSFMKFQNKEVHGINMPAIMLPPINFFPTQKLLRLYLRTLLPGTGNSFWRKQRF